MRPRSLLLSTLLVALAAAGPAQAEKKKLYRWTDAKGEVHYTDALPPEAAQAARDQLNEQGMAVDRVERALTAEERAAAAAEAARLAEEAKAAAEKAKMDAVLLASYPTEADLARAYQERFDLLERSLESAEASVDSQQRSLADLLTHAAALERSGQPVPAPVAQSILKTHQQAGEQRALRSRRQAERAALQQEYDGILARYRELSKAAAES